MGKTGKREIRTRLVTLGFLSDQLDTLAEFYNYATGYNERQKELLYKRLKLLTESQLLNAFETIKQTVEKFPTPVLILMHTRPAESEAAEKQKMQLIQKHGLCKWCQSTGMVVVFDKTDPLIKNHEVTMRCGECKIAGLTGVLRHMHAWTDDQMSDFEPTILEISMNANPTKGRLDEILEMPALERLELLHRQPWLKMALMFYGVDKRQGARQKQPNP